MEDIEGVRTADDHAPGRPGEAAAAATVAPVAEPAAQNERTPAAPRVCPFLVSVAADGALVQAIPTVAPANQCASSLPPLPQSARQQQLVCLQAAHQTCPRYLRGSLHLSDAPPPVARRKGAGRATVVALLILLFSASGGLAFAMVRGGLAVTGLATQPPAGSIPATVAAVASPTMGSVTTPTPLAASPPTPQPTPTHTPAATPHATAAATPRPTGSPSPTSSPAPSSGSASRYAVLTPCPDRPACYLYTVRSGDNLVSIVNWFGVPYDTVLRLNAWLTDPSLLRAGDRLVLPPPTR